MFKLRSVLAANSSVRWLLPMPAAPVTFNIHGSTALMRKGQRLQHVRSSSARPISGRRRAEGSTSAAIRSTSRNMSTGTLLPFTLIGSKRSRWHHRSISCAVRPLTRIRPGWAACSSRAAVLTASPVTKVRAPAANAATTSPVARPVRLSSTNSVRALGFFVQLFELSLHAQRRPCRPYGIVVVKEPVARRQP